MDAISKDEKLAFNGHIRAANACNDAGDQIGALHYYEAALAVVPSHEALKLKISKLRGKLSRPVTTPAVEPAKTAPAAVAATARPKAKAVVESDSDDDVVPASRVAASVARPSAAVSAPVPAPAPAVAAERKLVHGLSDSESEDDGPVVPRRAAAAPAVVAAAAATLRQAAAIVDDIDESDDDVVVPSRRPAVHAAGSAAGAVQDAARPAAGRVEAHFDEEDSDDDVVVPQRATKAAAAMPVVAPASPAVARPPKPARVTVDGYSIDPSAAPASSTVLATLPGGFGLPMRLFSQLYPYQRSGVAWMWTLHPECPLKTGALGRGQQGAPSSSDEGGDDEGDGDSESDEAGGWRAGRSTEKIAGGILADDMGLGKTLQTISFVSGLFHSEKAELVLVVAPLSVLPVWQAEFKRWAPEVMIHVFHGQTTEASRRKLLMGAKRNGGVVLTTYGLVTSAGHVLGADPAEMEAAAAVGDGDGDEEDGQGGDGSSGGEGDEDAGFARAPKGGKAAKTAGAPKKKAAPTRTRKPSAPKQRLDVTWDLVVTDEGHKLKNASTQVAKAMRALPSRARLLLSGTPVQNNLDEFWALFDYVAEGALLGTRREFNRLIGDRIVAARDRYATTAEKRDGHLATQQLARAVAPHMLRREKDKVFSITAGGSTGAAASAAADAEAGDGVDGLAAGIAGVSLGASTAPAARTDGRVAVAMGIKKEVVLWARPSVLQLALYRLHLASDDAQAVVKRAEAPLAAITVMRQISAHPLLLNPRHPLWAAVAEGDDGAVAALLSAAGLPLGGAPASSSSAARGSASRGGAGNDDDDFDPDRTRVVDTSGTSDAGDEDGAYGGAGSSALDVTAPVDVSLAPGAPLPLPPAEVIVGMSGKMATLVALLRLLVCRGHKVLLFSQSKRMLDFLGAVLRQLFSQRLDAVLRAAAAESATGASGHEEASSSSFSSSGPTGGVRFSRIDGDVPVVERRHIVESFNGGDATGPRVCLLTTGVGALGLTLTSADRVIIFDPSWNPTVDSQSVDRAYRLGQTRDVVTYRLISCGTVEERQYGRQVFKGGLERAVMGADGQASSGGGPGSRGGNGWVAPSRIMSRKELKELFTLGSTSVSETAQRLAKLAPPPPVRSPAVAAHLGELSGASPLHDAASARLPVPLSSLVASLSHHDHLLSITVSDKDAQEAVGAMDAHNAAREAGDAARGGGRLFSPGGTGRRTISGPRTLRKPSAAAVREASPGFASGSPFGLPSPVAVVQESSGAGVIDLRSPLPVRRSLLGGRGAAIDVTTPAAPSDVIDLNDSAALYGHGRRASGLGAGSAPIYDIDQTRAVDGDEDDSDGDADIDGEAYDGDATRAVGGGIGGGGDDGDEDDTATVLAGPYGGEDEEGGDVDGVMGQLALSPVFAPSGRPSRASLAYHALPSFSLEGYGEAAGCDDEDEVYSSYSPGAPSAQGRVSAASVATRRKKGLSLAPQDAAAMRAAMAEALDGDSDDGNDGDDDTVAATPADGDGDGGDAAHHEALLLEAMDVLDAERDAPGSVDGPTLRAMQVQAMEAAQALGLELPEDD